MDPMLVVRRHVDFLRVRSAICRMCMLTARR
jgi:hypothetical protein